MNQFTATLRPYQIDAFNWLIKQLVDCVYQAPTGTGKSKVIQALIEYLIFNQKKILVITPRKELCENLHDYFPSATVAFSGNQPAKTQVKNTQVLITTYKSSLKFIDCFSPDCIISDEAHGVEAVTWSNAVKQYKQKSPQLIHYGFTATPKRADGKPLSNTFQTIYTSPSIEWFIDQGYLSEYDLHMFGSPLFSDSKGDNLAEQDKAFRVQIPTAIDRWQELASDRKTLVFVPTVGYGESLLNQFESLGIAARFVHSKSSDRERDGIIDRFAASEFQVLINVELFTEGVNCPDIECLMLLRFTYSLKVYMQMVGRLLRVGKRRKMLMDFVNNCYHHGSVEFPHQWSLEGDKTKRGSNFDSPYYRCCNDDCARTFFKKTLVQCVTAVSCLKCQTETFVFPVDEPVKRNFRNLDKLIAVEKLELIDDKKITWLSRVLFNRSQPVEKRLESVINLGLPSDITRIGLEYLDIDEKRIRYYLED